MTCRFSRTASYWQMTSFPLGRGLVHRRDVRGLPGKGREHASARRSQRPSHAAFKLNDGTPYGAAGRSSQAWLAFGVTDLRVITDTALARVGSVLNWSYREISDEALLETLSREGRPPCYTAEVSTKPSQLQTPRAQLSIEKGWMLSLYRLLPPVSHRWFGAAKYKRRPPRSVLPRGQ